MKFSIFNFQFSNKNLGLITVLIVVGFFIYSFNLNNPLFRDDTDWIVNNPFVHSFSFENIGNWFTKNTLAGIGLKQLLSAVPFSHFCIKLYYFRNGAIRIPLGE